MGRFSEQIEKFSIEVLEQTGLARADSK